MIASRKHIARILFIAALSLLSATGMAASESAQTNRVPVVDGVVQPRRPVAEAMAEAMHFLKKADGGYVPGKNSGDLAGYFSSAFVKPDGTRSDRKLAYPARQHAYFIFTFLRYYAYTGEREWLLRARDLADWNLSCSTPATALYANLPYSTMFDGKPGGNRDQDAIEPDKAAFLASGYLAVYEATGEKKYLEGARAVAKTLTSQQREDGSWPFRVVPENGTIRQDFGGAPVFLVEFFENMLRHEESAAYKRAHDRALKYMLETNIGKNEWGTYHEDIVLKPRDYLSAEPMSFTADYLFRHGSDHPDYVDMGRKVIRRMEDRLVHTDGHAAAPAPAVSEQAGFDHIMPGHTARYCRALADLYVLTRDEQVKKRTLSAINATTYMQSPLGLFRTFFYSVKKPKAEGNKPDWYSQHLYTVCHLLEIMPCLPELAPEGQDHLLGSSVFIRGVKYSRGHVDFETAAAACTILKLSFVPKSVRVGGHELEFVKELTTGNLTGWCFDPASRVLTIRHKAGRVEVLESK